MSRKLCSVVAVPALLVLLTASAAQARSLAPQASPAGLLTGLWHWATSGLESIGIKAGGEMDPNGQKPHVVPTPPYPRSGGARNGIQSLGAIR